MRLPREAWACIDVYGELVQVESFVRTADDYGGPYVGTVYPLSLSGGWHRPDELTGHARTLAEALCAEDRT